MPFDFATEQAHEILQLELIDLQASTELKHLFRRIDKLQFYGEYVDDEVFYKANGNAYCSSYGCKLQIMKTKNRNRLGDESMTSCVVLQRNFLLTSKSWIITFKSKCHIEIADK